MSLEEKVAQVKANIAAAARDVGRDPSEITSPLQQFCNYFGRSDSRRCLVSKPDDFVTGESPPKQGLPVCGTQG